MAQHAGQPAVAGGQQRGVVLAVAAEQLVGAHARQQHLYPGLPGGSADEVGVDGGRVADRLVQRMHHAREQVGHVGGDLDLVQPDAVPSGQLAGVGQVVRHCLQAPVLGPERDRVAVDVAVVAGGQDGEQAGVQPAGQEGGDGHVGHQMRGDRVLEHARAAPPRRPSAPDGAASSARGSKNRSSRRRPSGPTSKPAAGWELVDALVDAVVLGDPVVHQRGHDGGVVDRRPSPEQGSQPLQLRGEGDAAVPRRPEQRLDAELVAGEGERALALVEQREREHAAQAAQARRAPPAPRLQQHLGVGVGAEADSRRRCSSARSSR